MLIGMPSYDRGMPHQACPEEMDDLEAFLSKVLPPKGGAGSSEKSKAQEKASMPEDRTEL
jgi:hypothetical protein